MTVALVLCASLLLRASNPVQERAPGVRSTTYVIEVDLERARALHWVEDGASDAALVETAARVVKRRFDAMEREFRLETDVEKHRLELTMPQVQPSDRELFGEMLGSIGVCELLLLPDKEALAELHVLAALEKIKLDAWREKNPTAPLIAFNAFPDRRAAPAPRIWWVEPEPGGAPMPLLLPQRPEDHFGAAGFAEVRPTVGATGLPAVGFRLDETRAADFARVCEGHAGRRFGIVFEGKLRATPTLNAKVEGKGIIEGRFTDDEVASVVAALEKRTGPLRVLEVR